MVVDRLLAFLSENSAKAVLVLVIIGGSVTWLAVLESDPAKALHERCAELQRERLTDGNWVFCRANLAIRPR
jgi:hypothetical protein